MDTSPANRNRNHHPNSHPVADNSADSDTYIDTDDDASPDLKGITRADTELLKKDKSLLEFLESMEEFSPLIPDALLDHYLTRSGISPIDTDTRIKRLLALCAQKFIADICTDAYQYNRIRNSSSSKKGAAAAKDKKTTLTMEDLLPALEEYGINVKKPDYYT